MTQGHSITERRSDPIVALKQALRLQRETMLELVQVSQNEQANLIAFDIKELSKATARRGEVLTLLAERQECSRTAFDRARIPRDGTVTELADRLEDGELIDLASALRALTEAVLELNAMTKFHAERSAGTTRAYAALLTRGRRDGAAPSTYNRSGKATHATTSTASIVTRSL